MTTVYDAQYSYGRPNGYATGYGNGYGSGAGYRNPYGGYGSPYYPYPPDELDTQGLIGGFLGGIAGKAIGGLFGDTGKVIGGAAGSIAGGFLPFSAGPGLAIAGAEPGGSNSAAAKPLLIPYDTLDPMTRASLDFGRAATKGLIDQLVKWVEKNQQNSDQIGEIVQLTTRAAELFLANDLPRAFAQAQLAYYALERARARIAGLAPLFG